METFCYIAALLWIPLAFVIECLEERELLRRFGTRYADYAGRVARFWPQTPAVNRRVKVRGAARVACFLP